MGTCAEVALPDPAHAGESTSPTESSPRFEVNSSLRLPSAPERRPRLLQDAAEADRAHFAGKARWRRRSRPRGRIASPGRSMASNFAPGSLRRKRLSGSSLFMPMIEFVIGRHADIRHKRGAVGKDTIVGGGRMRVRADNEAGATIAEKAHRLFFAGRLAMHINDDGIRTRSQRAGGQFALDRGEGIVERVHENAAHGIDHQRALAVLAFRPMPRRGRACLSDN